MFPQRSKPHPRLAHAKGQMKLHSLWCLQPLDFYGEPTEEPVVLAWVPAASIYFRDPDNNLLEFITVLPDPPDREIGVLSWDEWLHRASTTL
jgi:hypothetical protein